MTCNVFGRTLSFTKPSAVMESAGGYVDTDVPAFQCEL